MRQFRYSFLVFVCTLCLLLSLDADRSQAAEPPKEGYVLGVFPFLPAANLEGIFAPIAAELSRALGRPVRLRLAGTYNSFIGALQDKTFDIVHVHPFDYLQFARQKGYHPLVARSEDLFALFSVKNGSTISKIKDLKGKRVGHSITIPHTMFAAQDRIPTREREIIRSTLLASNLSQVDPHLRDLFIETGNTSTGRYFKAVNDRDYEAARKILQQLGSK